MSDPLILIHDLVGKRPWSVQLGIGSFLQFDFGNTIISSSGVRRGEWCLWLYCTPWRIQLNGQLLIGSEDEREKIKAALRQLEQKVVVQSRMDRTSMDVTIDFEGGLKLESFSLSNSDAEHWKLYDPQERILVAGPGFTLRYGRADVPRDALKLLDHSNS